MLLVIADDFSGAAEMAGIGHRFGLSSEIQLKFDPQTKAELVVVDSNTRSMNEADAITRTSQLCLALKSAGIPLILFKKVDSVMRGHIAAEANELQRQLGYERILLLPANPGRERIIRSGRYFIKETSLDRTVFAADPDFPVTAADMATLLKHRKQYLPHVHIKQTDKFPSSAFITADIEAPGDFEKYMRQATVRDLCCGAAECFEAFLKKQGYTAKKKAATASNLAGEKFSLIINGSTVRDNGEKELLEKLNLLQIPMPGAWEGDQFKLDEMEERRWQELVFETMKKNAIAAVAIDQPVKQIQGQPEVFSSHFVKLMHYISDRAGNDTIHFCLTGGATASAIVRSLGHDKLSVKEEVAPGAVTLAVENKLFTVKPGSYAWPESFLKQLSNQ